MGIAIFSGAALVAIGAVVSSTVAVVVGIGILVFIGAGIYFSG